MLVVVAQRSVRWRASRWLLLALVLMPLASVLAAVRMEIVGIDGQLHDNVRNHIGQPPDDDPRLIRRFASRIPDQARDGLEALGYYEAEVDVTSRRIEDDWLITVTVEPGEPVRIRTLDIVFHGEAGTDGSFLSLRELVPLKEGDVLHHGRYESTKRAIEGLAASRGYFDGVFRESRIAIHRGNREADITLHYDSGARYLLGEVRYPETPLSEDLLQRMVPFSSGEPYTSEKISALNRNLLDSEYFQHVRVRPQQAEKDEEGRIPVDAEVTAHRPNRVGVGVGFATDVGPRLRLSWRKPYVNEEGHSLKTETEVSAVRQNISSEYSIPLDPPTEQQLQFFGGYQRDDIEDTFSRKTTAGIQRMRTLTGGWQQAWFLRWEREIFTQAEQRGSSTLTLPGTNVTRSRSRGGMDPHWGDRQFAQVEGTHPELGSDLRLAWLRLNTTWLRSTGRHRGIVRAEYGVMTTSDFRNTPPSLRFFAGGDRSVRGFRYQSLGPRDDEDRLIGGRYLLVGSAEYSYEFRERWRAAAFYDVGNAFSSSSFDEGFERGTGVGIRWSSPVGPIKLDLAWGISQPGTPFRLHFSVGPEI